MKRIPWLRIWQWIWRGPSSWTQVPPGTPIRRDAKMLYVFMCTAGAFSGVVVTNPALGLPELSGSEEAALLIGGIGLFTGWLTAHWLEQRYITAANAWPWLAFSAMQLVAAPLVFLAALSVIGAVLAVLAAIFGIIFLFVLLIFLIFGSFGG